MLRLLRPILLCAALLLPAAPSLPAASRTGEPVSVNLEQISPGDAFAWSLLGVLGLTLGLVTACGLGVYRQFRRVTPQTEQLEEIKQAARHSAPDLPLPAPSAAPWERPADWWKGEPKD